MNFTRTLQEPYVNMSLYGAIHVLHILHILHGSFNLFPSISLQAYKKNVLIHCSNLHLITVQALYKKAKGPSVLKCVGFFIWIILQPYYNNNC
jgi:hypothetical protein